MRYQEYQQKVEKLAKVRKFLFRYRVPFILAIASILSLTIVLMAIAGTVQDTSCPTSFIYGDDISYTASAIMNDVYYEYSVDGVTWQTVVPTEVGKYKVRAVSKGVFGSTRIGDIHDFEILPKQVDVSIEESSIVYGDLPTVKAPVEYEDIITCSSFSYEDSSLTSTTVSAKKDAISVINKEGIDVTSSYEFNIIPSTIYFSKRPITITISGSEKDYDSDPLTCDGWDVTSGSLANDVFGDNLVLVQPYPTITDVGTIKNNHEFKIYNKLSQDVTSQYDISTIFGNLTINKKLIKITTKDFEAYYDGEEHNQPLFDSTPLANEYHQLVVTSDTKIKDVNEEDIENILQFSVFDQDQDITSNYNLVVTYGKLVIKPREITIKSNTSSLIYNGKEQDDKTYEVLNMGLAGDDEVNVYSAAKLKDCGSLENEIKCKIISTDEFGNRFDNTYNYSITYKYGTLTIQKKPVKLTSTTNSFEYDGNDHKACSYVAEEGYDIVKTHKVRYLEFTTVNEVIDSKENKVTISILDENENDVSSNYQIELGFGTLSVTPRIATLTTVSASKVYDGTALTCPSATLDRILQIHELVITSIDSSLTDVYFDGNEVSSIANELKCKVVDSNNNDVTSNYDITPNYGTLKIELRPLNVATESKIFVYEGKDLSWPEFSLENGTSFVEGQIAEVINAATVKNVSDSGIDNTFELRIWSNNSKTTNVTKNYDISYTYGTLSVNQKDISITAGSSEKNYDGEILQNNVFTQEGLITGHIITNVNFTGSQLDVGESDNVIAKEDIVIKSSSEEDVTANYNLTVNKGTLKVTPRPITITTATNSWVYSDQDKSDTSHSVTTGSLVTSLAHYTKVDDTKAITSIKTVCENVQNIFAIKILDGDEEDQTSNYAITYTYGTLTITQKPIEIVTQSYSWEYDGTEHSYDELDAGYTQDGLIDGHTITVESSTSIKNKASESVYNEITISISNGEDVTENYAISYTYSGILSITPRPISVQIGSNSFVYDGTAKTYTAYEVTSAKDLVNSQVINVLESTSEINVGEYDNNFTSIEILDGDIDVKDSYDISYTKGTITITKRDITITADSKQKEYDGTPITIGNDEFTCGENELVEGQTIVCEINYDELIFVGQTASEISTYAIYNNDVDVTSNYNVKTEYGVLKVVERAIEITTGSAQFEYDGAAHSCTSFEITSSNNLVGIDAISDIVSTSITNVYYVDSTVSSVDNIFSSLKIKNGDNDLTANYSISYVYGTLTVTPKALTITADDKQKEYDGNPLSLLNTEFTQVGLIDSHTSNITIKISGSITYFGETPSVPSDAVIVDAATTLNYAITYVNGTLSITKRALVITTNTPDSKVYDGTFLSGTYSIDATKCLVENDEILNANITLKTIKNVGNVTHSVEALKITNKFSGEDATGSYDISYITGYLEITPRPLIITTPTVEKAYDTTPLFDIENYTIESPTSLVEGQELIVSEYSELTEVGSIDNEYTVIIKDINDDVTSNYEIKFNKGTITVTERELTIKVNDLVCEYTSETITQTDKSEFTITSGSLIDGHRIDIDNLIFTGGRINRGTYENEISIEITSIKVLDENDEEVNYYSFIVENGDLEITKREIIISTQSMAFEYDNEIHSYHEEGAGYEITVGSMLGDDELIVASYPTVQFVSDGEVDNIITFELDDSIKDNYTITVSEPYGKISIAPRRIDIISNDVETTYDGQAHFDNGFTVDPNYTLVDGHQINLVSYTSVIDVNYDENGEVTTYNNIIVVTILNGDSIDVSANYDIRYVVGTILINPKAITIKTTSAEKEYDATELVGQLDGDLELASGDFYDLALTSIKDAGSVLNEVTSIELYRLDNLDHVDVSKNYTITYDCGTLTILKRSLELRIKNGSWAYDGELHTQKEYDLVDPSSLLDIHEIKVVECASIRNCGTKQNFLTISIVSIADNSEIVTQNYEITQNTDALLEVTKVDLVVNLQPSKYEYDGEAHDSTSFTNSGLASTDYINITTTGIGVNAGEYQNEIATIEIISIDGNDSSNNYNVTLNGSTITILKREITIKSEDCHEIYQEGHTYNHNVVNVTNGSLVLGHKLVTTTVILGAQYEDGTENTILSFDIVDALDDTISYKDNYEVTVENGRYFIGKPYIYVESASKTIFYDELTGTYLEDTSYTKDDTCLLEGHELSIVVTGKLDMSIDGNITALYGTGTVSIDNIVEVHIIDSISKENVDSMYDIETKEGTLAIKLRTFSIVTGSGIWPYDNEEHSSEVVEVVDTEIKEGYILTYTTPTVTIKDPGKKYNEIEWSIVDANTSIPLTLEEVKKYYLYNVEFGQLIVTGRPIVLQSASDSTVYVEDDPSTHSISNSRVDIIYADLFENHVIDNSIYTAAKTVLESEGTTVKADNIIDSTKLKVFELLTLDAVFDESIKYYTQIDNIFSEAAVTSDTFASLIESGLYIDVTSLYNFEQITGTLTIYGEEEEEDEDEDSTLITIISNSSGIIYLKTNAFAEYKKTGSVSFNNATAAAQHITVDGHNYSADYIFSLILKEYGRELFTASISSYVDYYMPLPYYMSLEGDYDKQTSDASYTGDTSTQYNVGYYTLSFAELKDLLNRNASSLLSDDLKTAENAYYNEIKDKYTQIDEETKTYMDSIISAQDLNNSNLSIYQKIAGVASYIQASADYSLAYDSDLDNAANVAIAFLETYKVGVCRHFATAATMLYRALGIPARYVHGFVANIGEANTPVNVTRTTAHAWVEVYIKGYGWVQVEVTGGGNFGGLHSDGEHKEDPIETPDSLTIVVRPMHEEYEYDGQSHGATRLEMVGTEEYGITALELLGYTFDSQFSGEGTLPGIYNTSIIEDTFRIYKKNTEGVTLDITSNCDITFETNTIDITKKKVTIKSTYASWPYDGETHSKDGYTITDGGILTGDQEYVSCISQIRQIGKVDNDFTYYILNSDGVDVTDLYEVTKEYGELSIEKIGLRIDTRSASKLYDGTPLTCEEYDLTGNLYGDHVLHVLFTGEITEVGTTNNTATCEIVDGDGNDVSSYYSIDMRYGLLEIKTKKITVTSKDKSKVYDGTPLAGDPNGYSYTEDILPDGYSIIVNILGVTPNGNVQSVDNTFEVILKDSLGNPTTEFEIEYIYGKLTITKAPVFIHTGSASAYYDGITELKCEEYTYNAGGGLLTGHHIYNAQNWTSLKDIPLDARLKEKDGVKYYEVINSANFIIQDENGVDVTANYRFETDNYGKLTLYKKAISIVTGSAEKEYDGTPLVLERENDDAFSISSDALFDGHTITLNHTASITEVGSTTNTYEITILDADDNDVTYLYELDESFGTLTVKQRIIKIKTASDSKKYDGTPLTNPNYEIVSGSVLEELGHKLYVNVNGSALNSTQPNTAEAYVYIEDEEGETILGDSYYVLIETGQLEIILRQITIISNGKNKVYDGTPLRNNDPSQITIYGDSCLEEGHTLYTEISDDVFITYIEGDNASVVNTVTYYILDADGNDVTNLYAITEQFGFLVLNPATIVIETGSKKSTDASTPLTYDSYTILNGTIYDEYSISITGQQVGYGFSHNTYEFNCAHKDCYAFDNRFGLLVIYKNDDSTGYAQVYSSTDTNMFLKETSFGEYTKTGWASASDYSLALKDFYSMTYLPSITLKNTLKPQSAKIIAYNHYALPYYLDIDSTKEVQQSDVRSSGLFNNAYSVDYYAFNTDSINSLSYVLGSYYELEQAYREYVYATYLDVPSTTAEVIQLKVLNASGLNKTSLTFYKDVLDLIKKKASYDENYNKAIDSSSDLVASFITLGKGVSKHFASLATLTFRMLGIPARYVVGGVGQVSKNTWSLLQSKSFVEIYIDNFGWIALDATPEKGQGEDDPEIQKVPLTIKPVDMEKAYNGSPLVATELEESDELTTLALNGYTWDFTISGSQTQKGESESVIDSFTIYNADGDDVTSLFDITKLNGKLRVTNVQILVYLYTTTVTYGEIAKFDPDFVFYDFEILSDGILSSDYELSFDVSSISLTEAGTLDYDELRAVATIMKGDQDYTSSFYLVFDGEGLIVERRQLTITSGSFTSSYDGSILTCDTYNITMGSLVSGDRLEVTLNGKQVGVGSSNNTFDTITIYNASGDDVTSSYNITTIEGKLTITE